LTDLHSTPRITKIFGFLIARLKGFMSWEKEFEITKEERKSISK
jgi:hypothetical protein